MTIDELFEFLSKQIELELSELTEYMEKENIQPKTKISNIPRYEQEDCQAVFDYFVSVKPKRTQKKKPPVIQESKTDPQAETLEIRDYTIPEIAALLNENKTKFYRFVGQHKIKPAAVKNKTKYFSYEDTLRIIDHFTDLESFNVTVKKQTEPAAETAAVTEEKKNETQEEPERFSDVVTSEPEHVTVSELNKVNAELHGETDSDKHEENAGTISELPVDSVIEPTTDIQEEKEIEPNELQPETNLETTEKKNSYIAETVVESNDKNSEIGNEFETVFSDETKEIQQRTIDVTEDISAGTDQIFSDQKHQQQLTEIMYLKRENELLRSELDQKNRQLAELTQRLEQAQYLHSKTQTISEKQQPFFKMPEIIEADKIETTEPTEQPKRRFLGIFKEK